MYLVKEVILWGIWLSLSRKHFGELPQCFHCEVAWVQRLVREPTCRALVAPQKKRREKKLQTIKGSLCGLPHHPPRGMWRAHAGPGSQAGSSPGASGHQLAAAHRAPGGMRPSVPRCPTLSCAHRPDPMLVAQRRGHSGQRHIHLHTLLLTRRPTPWPWPGRTAQRARPAQLPAPASFLPSRTRARAPAPNPGVHGPGRSHLPLERIRPSREPPSLSLVLHPHASCGCVMAAETLSGPPRCQLLSTELCVRELALSLQQSNAVNDVLSPSLQMGKLRH